MRNRIKKLNILIRILKNYKLQPDDIYSTLKENEKKIIENFNSKNMSHIQFVEEVISEYKKNTEMPMKTPEY